MAVLIAPAFVVTSCCIPSVHFCCAVFAEFGISTDGCGGTTAWIADDYCRCFPHVCVCGSTVCTPPLSCSLQAIANDDDAPPPVPSCCMYCPHALPITDAQLRASSATVPRCLWNDVRGSCSPLQLLYLALEPPTPTTLWHKCVRLVWRSVACQYISRSSACRRISPHHSSHSNTMACRRKCAHMVATKPPLCTVTLSVCCMG